jgi:hypothetical protein
MIVVFQEIISIKIISGLGVVFNTCDPSNAIEAGRRTAVLD